MLSLRNRLEEELLRRRRKNPSYSLRAFARYLGVSPTSLSLFLNGRRKLSSKSVHKISQHLAVSAVELKEAIGRRDSADTQYEELSLDQLRLVADWFYFALLSLMEIPGFQPEYAWIAKRLGITVRQARSAMARLERVGAISRAADGKWRLSGKNFRTPDQVPQFTIRKSHEQALELARASLERYGVDKRNYSAMTIALDPDRLPEAAERIRRFRRQLARYLSSGPKKEVYRLCVQLFPLSHGVPSAI